VYSLMGTVDLGRAVGFRGYALNAMTETAGVVVGCLVDTMEIGEIELRQFTEPLALQNGLDFSGVWRGARTIRITGTVYDETRATAFDRLAALEAIMVPDAEYVATPASMGFGALTWYPIGGGGLKTINARSNGLRFAVGRSLFGGDVADPLAIPWSLTLFAKDPVVF